MWTALANISSFDPRELPASLQVPGSSLHASVHPPHHVHGHGPGDTLTQSLLINPSTLERRKQERNTVTFGADEMWRQRRRWCARIGVPGIVQTFSGTTITIKDAAVVIKDTCARHAARASTAPAASKSTPRNIAVCSVSCLPFLMYFNYIYVELNWLIDQLQTAFLQKYYIFSGIA
jgi:hypothetical protein